MAGFLEPISLTAYSAASRPMMLSFVRTREIQGLPAAVTPGPLAPVIAGMAAALMAGSMAMSKLAKFGMKTAVGFWPDINLLNAVTVPGGVEVSSSMANLTCRPLMPPFWLISSMAILMPLVW